MLHIKYFRIDLNKMKIFTYIILHIVGIIEVSLNMEYNITS